MTTRNGYDCLKYTVTLADAVHFIDGIDAHMAPFVPIVRKYADAIGAELAQFDAFRESDSVTHAQACLLFAMLSPQCRFAVNVRASQRMLTALYRPFDDVESVYQCLTDGGRDSWVTAGMGARAVFASLEFLRNVTDDDMTKPALLMARKNGAIRGIAHKTASMACALYDGALPVFTLDVHMLRGIQRSYGGTIGGSMSVQDRAYVALEVALVEWATRTFPDLPVFVSQWALWNEWGFGNHVSHLGIFGLE